MERVDGHKSTSNLYILNDFLYQEERRRGDTIYFRCRHWQMCRGRIISNNGVLQLTREHNHEADHVEAQLCRFKTVLRRRARLENTSFETIFREEERHFPEAARNFAGLRSFSSTMGRAREHGTPRIPETLLVYSETIRHRDWFQRYGVDLSPEENPFFSGHVLSGDGSTSVLFISHAVLQHVRGAPNVRLHMDATFKVVPRAGNALQLFTVHILHDDMTFPLLYALMERKTRAAYSAVLLHLQRVLGNVAVQSVMADYESAMRMAVVRTFPGTSLRGCWFHFARAIFKKSRELGYQRPAMQPATRPIIRAAMSLPLLPQNMLEGGVVALEAMGAQANIDMAPFILYLRRQWLPLQISVHGEYHRTNNSVEAFHRQLYRVVERAHPNIWRFTEKLKEMEHAKANDLHRLINGAMMPNRRRQRYIRLDQRIRLGEERLAADGNINRFLRFMAYGVYNLERIMNGIPDLPPIDPPNVILPAAVAPLPQVAALPIAIVPLPNAPAADVPLPPAVEVPPDPPVALPNPEIPPEWRCAVCLTNPKSHVLLDCRHFCMCDDCVGHFRVRWFDNDDAQEAKCPVCRAPIITAPMRVIL